MCCDLTPIWNGAVALARARMISWSYGIWQSRRTVRLKMRAIFAFFSVVSTLLVVCLAVALINVVIRRETAYLIED